MVVPKEGVPIQAFSAALVKNTPNEKNALDFINYLISEESQALIAEQGFYPVVEGDGASREIRRIDWAKRYR